jgi:threonine dehydratase
MWDEADRHARDPIELHGHTYVHPFDDFDLMAGQCTVGWEIYHD